MVQSKKTSEFSCGTITQLLLRSYASYHKEFPQFYKENIRLFTECNDFFYTNIEIGNKYCVISTVDELPIGMCCWDPRNPPVAEIGQNCILPEYRSQGFGKEQLRHVIETIKLNGYTTVKVSTGQQEFYYPAQKQYESVGFKEIKRDVMKNTNSDQLGMIYYELSLI